jgi:hypothetical protein
MAQINFPENLQFSNFKTSLSELTENQNFKITCQVDLDIGSGTNKSRRAELDIRYIRA